MAKYMSDAEMKRRKALQGKISQTTSTLGLTGLGLTAGSALAARNPKVLNALRKLPKGENLTPEKMKNTAINTGLVSGGIGGVGGYNFAAYTNAEAKRRNQVKKAWEPVGRNYSPEQNRAKRAKNYQTGAYVVGGAGAGTAAAASVKAVRTDRGAKKLKAMSNRIPSAHPANGSGAAKYAAHKGHLNALAGAEKLKVARHLKTAKVGALVGAAGLAGGAAIKDRRKNGAWFGKSATSAFGIKHY